MYSLSQILSIETIHNADIRLEPGSRAYLDSDGIQSKDNPSLSVLKDYDHNIWFEIKGHHLAEKIVSVLSQDTKRKMLFSIKKPSTREEIIEKNHLSASVGYRQLTELLDEGLVIPVGYTENIKRVRLFDTVFTNVEVNMNTKSTQVRIQLKMSVIPKPEPVLP